METTEIRSRVIDIMTGIMPTWNKIDIKDTDNIREDIGMESIDFLDIIMQTEIMFDIKIEPEEAAKAKTVADFISLVESKLK